MTSFEHVNSIQEALSHRAKSDTVGFVPTMGALHEGHLSLVNRALQENNIVVVSIFVNPTQFNNKEDLKKYPRNLENDLKLLSTLDREVLVFAPDVDEVYPAGFKTNKVDLGAMATVMEGKFRPGHFDGVVEVVSRLFEIIKPDRAYFGQKDFQQLAIIHQMTHFLGLPVEIIPCETIREVSGLARSSRNERLTDQQKVDALVIYKALQKAKELFAKDRFKDILPEIEKIFEDSPLRLEYFELVDPVTLMRTDENSLSTQACIAAFCGDVRLIDNMLLEKEAI